MLIGTVIIVALAILIGALFLHMCYTLGSMKGYEQGLDDAERIFIETRRKSDE